jgi:hypothetical protein
MNDDLKLLRAMTADLRAMTRAAQRRAAKIRAEIFQKREIGSDSSSNWPAAAADGFNPIARLENDDDE